MTEVNRRWIYAQKPEADLTHDHFYRDDQVKPLLEDGKVLVKLRMVSIEPANRVWMSASASEYKEALNPGDVMHGFALGDVVESASPLFSRGDTVAGLLSWQDYVLAHPEQLLRFDQSIPPEEALSVYWVSGLAAWYGLTKVARIKSGETVVISAAGGAVGTIAGQIAKAMGCKVIGIAGGQEKCSWIRRKCGYDKAIDYKLGNLKEALHELAPSGVDVYFDNVGGEILDTVFTQMNLHGRIAICGAVSLYNNDGLGRGPDNFAMTILSKRMRAEGFMVTDYVDDWPKAMAEMSKLIDEGKLSVPLDILEGFELLPAALVGLLAGENRGKRLVRIC